MSFLKEGPVALIARLVRAEALINEDLVLEKANRVSFEFDTIDARMSPDDAVGTIYDKRDRSRLALLKILTTADHFAYLSNVGEVFDGQWFHITLLPRGKKSGPFAWASSLGDEGYEENVPLVLDQIRFLFSEGESPLAPVGAAVAEERALAQIIAEACKFPACAIGKSSLAGSLLCSLSTPHSIVVRDVGQASFCSAIDQDGNELFHLDAGWPISYNMKTVSIKPSLTIQDAPVILSHWDWDHLHGYHAIAGLRGSIWVAPVQRLGPGAKLVAENLAKNNRLLGVSSANVSAGPIRLGRCKGKVGVLNQTGLCIQTTLQSGKMVLFMGDADYDLVRLRPAALPDYIIATHHGAKFGGAVVSPNSGHGRCVISVGKGNGYGHPSEEAIRRHQSAGWSMSFTSERNHVSRGSRYLGP